MYFNNNVIEIQRYNSYENREQHETVIQTTIPTDMWSSPPAPPPRLPPRQPVFMIPENELQMNPLPSNREMNCCCSKGCCAVFRLIISCMFLFIVTLGLLGYSVFIAREIYNLAAESADDSDPVLWKYTDETTVCLSLSGKGLQHSGCAKYLFHDISDSANYTCCVRDSKQYSFLYQLVHIERKRLGSSAINKVCLHANAEQDESFISNDVLLWEPYLHCNVTGQKEQDGKLRKIEIPSSNMYSIYLALPIKYQETYKILRNHKIRVRLFRQHANQILNDEELLHKMIGVRKEHYNFDNIFMHGTFYLEKGDRLYVQATNDQFLYTYDAYASIDLYKIL